MNDQPKQSTSFEEGRLPIVFMDPFGFVTDFGEALHLSNPDGTRALTVPRYGVWKHSGRKFEVVMTTDNLDAAITEAKREESACPRT